MELALTLFAIDPAGLRGIWLRGRAGPVRDQVIQSLAAIAPRKLHPFMDVEALEGGLDLTATLATGQLHHHRGLLSQDGVLLLTMAERCPAGLAARLGQALDTQAGLSLVALDETADEAEGLPNAIADRLGLFLDVDGFALSDSKPVSLCAEDLAAARARLPLILPDATARARLTYAAAQLGIASLRAPLLALACARAHAALRGCALVEDADLQAAAELVLAHRATRLPEDMTDAQDDQPPSDPPPPPDTPEDPGAEQDSRTEFPDEMLIDAARACLPPGLLAQLQAAKAARMASSGNSGAGAKRKSMRRGRPLPSRAGKPGAGARVDVIASLRQAAPWQAMRKRLMPHAPQGRLLLLPSDIRIRRYQDQTDRVLIFVVDASGSAALARLAEAKGAVELMLASAYSSRDHVALVTFRGHQAELALPPTRSLVQTKRRLAGLPGGGPTPLASALQIALQTAQQARRQGMTPTLALLTDGRGNITLDGQPDRALATQEASHLARQIAQAGCPALVIDTSLRPKPQLAQLATEMGATMIVLPHADARSLSTTLAAGLGG